MHQESKPGFPRYTARMLELVDHLAELGALRERDALDLALVNAICDVLQPQSVSICRAIGDPDNERWRLGATAGAGQKPGTGDSAWAALESLPRLDQHPLRQQALRSGQIQSASGTPALTEFPLGCANGVLELHTEAPLSAENSRLVSGILRLYLNVGKLLDYGERDSLTDLLNRKTFDGAFLKATVEQRHSAAPAANQERRDTCNAGSYWLCMIDIDHFKRVNDNYGHLIGDEVLLLLARLMRSQFRFHDLLYRFGGEEFVVLMRCCGETEAGHVLERMRAATEAHLFPQVGQITVSIGFSEVRTGDSPSGAFERADKAVYYAKEHGRNQVCSYAALVARGELDNQASNVGDMELF